MTRRSVVLLDDQAALPASTTKNIPVPSWARVCIIHWNVTADGTGAGTVQVRQKSPSGLGTPVNLAGLVTDALTVSTVNNRSLAFGAGVGIESGASYDTKPIPVSKYMDVVIAESAGALTASKVYAEFIE